MRSEVFRLRPVRARWAAVRSAPTRKFVAAGAVAATALAACVAVTTSSAVAAAAVPTTVSPVVDRNPTTGVTADALPTVQIDGVVWSQAIVGNTVWAGGSYNNARPAGAAPGTNQTARHNLLAYNLGNGALITSIVPSLNAQVKVVAASPDGSRIYVGGSFTTANGQTHNRIAAYDAKTGAIISSFTASVDSSVYAIAATNTTVYVGGAFSRASGVPRNHLAAFNASNGALTSWAPTADYNVDAMVLTPDGQKVVVGGEFTKLDGTTALGLGAVDPATGARVTWNASNVVHDSQPNAAILSLSADAQGNVYGSGYVYGASGDLEGAFQASQTNGDLNWVEDCHGDTYGVAANSTSVYTVSHAHYCGNIGGFQQSSPGWTYHRTMSFTKNATGTIQHNPYASYKDWYGTPSPSIIDWFPELAVGTVTGTSQAAWTVTANNQYVVEGGEFPKVNNVGQQGLVRFAIRSLAPNKRGPQLYSAADTDATAVSLSRGTARVTFPSNWDPDNMNLTYKVYRDSTSSAPVYTVTAASTSWYRPELGFVDTGLTPGQTYKYRVVVSDPDGNTSRSWDWASVTVASGNALSSYANDVLGDGASSYWRLGDSTGTTAYDLAGHDPLIEYNAVGHGAPGAILGDSDTASTFDGTSAYAATNDRFPAPNTFTLEAWFKTTSTAGGKIIGFGNFQEGTGSNHYDRHVYMDAAGHVYFGVYNGGTRTLQTPGTYNNGAWHYVVASLSSAGMALYVDGRLVSTNPSVTSGEDNVGYWRVGGDSTWSGKPYFKGAIDEVAVYRTALTLGQVRQHYSDSGRTLPGTAPADAYGKAVYNSGPSVYYRLDGTSGPATDASGNGVDGTYFGTVTRGVSSPVTTEGTAARFSGTTGSELATNQSFAAPQAYSEELWFNTTTTSGGKLIGFGNAQSGASSSYDRHVYMETNGQLTFGVWVGSQSKITSSKSYNDGKWHYLVATQGSDGMKLYVDDQLVASSPQTSAQSYTGYWRVGGDRTWNGTSYFAGTIDEVAVYQFVLTPQQISAHYAASPAGAATPVASFTTSTSNLTVSVDGTGSSETNGTVASYSWDFGDGSAAGSGATASHTYAKAGTYTVVLTVTDGNGVTGTASKQVTVAAANQKPVASFTASTSNLTVSVDGTGSSDPDGTVASYSWDFGDGSAAGSGATASHTYAKAGTYTVALTVTDNDGATGTASKQVTVAAANQKPVASFTASTSNLTVSVDGTGSSDPDGTVASYSWDFGDGSAAGSGATASHTYAKAGTYTVALTVTDNDGATGTASKQVTVAASGSVAADSFTRTVTGKWGSADVGGAWTLFGAASRFSVNGSVGLMTLPKTGVTDGAYLNGISQGDVNMAVDVSTDKLPTGTGTTISLLAHRSGSSDYRLTARLLSGGAVHLMLYKVVSGKATGFGAVNVGGLTYTSADVLRLRFRVTAQGAATVLAGKAWKVGTAEPSGNQITATDSTAALQGPGAIGLNAFLASNATNAPVVARFDNLAVTAG